MFIKLWNYFFVKKVTLLALPATSFKEVSANQNMFQSMFLEEAAERLKKEADFLSSENLSVALRKAVAYTLSQKDHILISASDIGISKDLLTLFFEVFAQLCKENNIQVEMIKGTSEKYIKVDKQSFDVAMSLFQDKARRDLIDNKIGPMFTTGIYR